MYASPQVLSNLWRVLIPGVLVAVCVAAAPVWGADEAPALGSDAPLSSPYTLTVGEGVVSVQARDASLLAILEELGKRAGFVVKSDLATDLRVTLEFADLPLRQAVQRLTEGTDVVAEFSHQPGGLNRLILLSGGTTRTPPEIPGETTDPQRPFQFEFDPAAAISE